MRGSAEADYGRLVRASKHVGSVLWFSNARLNSHVSVQMDDHPLCRSGPSFVQGRRFVFGCQPSRPVQSVDGGAYLPRNLAGRSCRSVRVFVVARACAEVLTWKKTGGKIQWLFCASGSLLGAFRSCRSGVTYEEDFPTCHFRSPIRTLYILGHLP